MDNNRFFEAPKREVQDEAKEKTLKTKKDKTFALALVIAVTTIGFFCGILFSTIKYYSNFIPSLDQLEKIEPALITQVFDSEGELLKEYFIQKRELVPIDSMPSYLVNGLVAVEDKNFRSHWGVDVTHGVLRAVLYQVFKGKSHGGSSITQQLARNLFLDREHSIERKIKEAITAFKIEQTYSKNEIIEFYLNQVNLGGAYGVQAAANRYYSKDVKDLTIDEAAIFIGMLKAPNSYRPDYKPERSKKRRDVVLSLMLKNGAITQAQYSEAVAKPIVVNPYKEPLTIAPYFLEKVRIHVAEKYGDHALYKDGLKIYTTLNSKDQLATEKSMTKNLRVFQKELNGNFYGKYLRHRMKKAPQVLRDIPIDSLLYSMDTILYNKNPEITEWMKTIPVKPEDTLVTIQGSFLALDSSGAVKSFIGGRNFEESEFNRVYSKRQPGSAYKPFIYLAGLMKGFTASSILLDQPIVILNEDERKDKNGKIEDDWRPKNHGGKFKGPVLYCDALSKSMNLATIYLLNKISPQYAIDVSNKFELTSNYEAVPALSLGVFDLSLWQLVKAYSVFQNEGKMVEPYFISRIEDNEGNILEEYLPESKQILPLEMNYAMGVLLRNVISRGTGFGAVAKGFTHPAGGKTGTTNASTDNWFLGYSKYYTAGCWIGSDIKRQMGRRTGASTALPIWTDFMIESHKDLPKKDFKIPKGIVFKNVCTETGKIATKHCPKVYYNTPFITGTQPKDECDKHGVSQAESAISNSSNPWDNYQDNDDFQDENFNGDNTEF